MAGALRQIFGVCASEWSPSDGSVVSLDHGCGAHSEVDVDVRPEPLDSMVLDELGYEPVDVRGGASARRQGTAGGEGSVGAGSEAGSEVVVDEVTVVPEAVVPEAVVPEAVAPE